MEHLSEIRPIETPYVTDLLYSFGMVGHVIQVFRTESSNINPWTIQVTYVLEISTNFLIGRSPTPSQIPRALCAH